MKIRDRVTNEVYDAFSHETWNGKIQYCKVGTNGPLRYADQVEILEEDKPKDDFDWQSFRREAAKDIFCAMLYNKNGATITDVISAIQMADELIKQLKEG